MKNSSLRVTRRLKIVTDFTGSFPPVIKIYKRNKTSRYRQVMSRILNINTWSIFDQIYYFKFLIKIEMKERKVSRYYYLDFDSIGFI